MNENHIGSNFDDFLEEEDYSGYLFYPRHFSPKYGYLSVINNPDF
jgi:hypothetical protein